MLGQPAATARRRTPSKRHRPASVGPSCGRSRRASRRNSRTCSAIGIAPSGSPRAKRRDRSPLGAAEQRHRPPATAPSARATWPPRGATCRRARRRSAASPNRPTASLPANHRAARSNAAHTVKGEPTDIRSPPFARRYWTLRPIRPAIRLRLHLRGAGGDRRGARIAEMALHVELHVVAEAAHHLHADVGRLDVGLRGQQLGHGDLAQRILSARSPSRRPAASAPRPPRLRSARRRACGRSPGRCRSPGRTACVPWRIAPPFRARRGRCRSRWRRRRRARPAGPTSGSPSPCSRRRSAGRRERARR